MCRAQRWWQRCRAADTTLAEERKGASLCFLKLGLGRGLCLRNSNDKEKPTASLNRPRYLVMMGCPQRFPGNVTRSPFTDLDCSPYTRAVCCCHVEKEHQRKALENSRGKTLYEKENSGKRKDTW